MYSEVQMLLRKTTAAKTWETHAVQERVYQRTKIESKKIKKKTQTGLKPPKQPELKPSKNFKNENWKYKCFL